MRILILGGTSEGSEFAGRVAGRAGIEAVLSLAGRTGEPKQAPVPMRSGGFGGIEGLSRYLASAGIDAVVDATHPFAEAISRHAALACRAGGVPLFAIRRPAWPRQPGDRWIEAATMAEAAEAIGADPRRVFLTVGRLELAVFAAAPQHRYLVRTIEPIGSPWPVPSLVALRGRGPFREDEERALMLAHGIEVLVTKNSGGAATYGKIAAARRLGLPAIVVAQPRKPDGMAVGDVAAALAWLDGHAGAPQRRGV